ncbi:COMM domain-containing protein 8 [Bulinus truncatus]|nr:COMM domain-containing protein 8 [Bulinus truncatus]
MAAEKWESAVAEISKANQQDFGNLCHLIANSICRDGALDPGKYMSIWSLEKWWQVQTALIDILRKAVGKNWTNDKICEVLGKLDDSYKKVICDAVAIHKTELRNKLVQETTAVSYSVLTDFNWKLKLSLASDKLASLQEPLLQLDLDVRENSGKKRLLTIELDRNELSKLISSLESCSKSVQQLTITV